MIVKSGRIRTQVYTTFGGDYGKMAFHIPFNQRASAQQPPTPIYIGFEVQRPPRKKFNWWGFNGMWMSVASLASAGFLSPVPLLISLVGLRRPGKKMASVGTFVSFAGIALATTIVLGTIFAHNHQIESRRTAHRNHVIKKQSVETKALMALAAEDIIDAKASSQLPSDLRANELVVGYIDPWGESLRFDMEAEGGNIRSAGPDVEFNTSDDLTIWVDGETEKKQLLLDVIKKEITEQDLMED